MYSENSNTTSKLNETLARHKKRERYLRSLAAINAQHMQNTKKTEATMTYTVKLPFRNTNHIFGNAYPHLALSANRKCNFIRSLLLSTLAQVDGTQYNHMVDIDFLNKLKMFEVRIAGTDRRGYTVAQHIEKSFPNRWPRINIAKMWRIFKTPCDSFLLNENMYGKVMAWVTTNIKTSDYQVYSKFGGDVSIGFRSSEHATMFKLMFAEEDI
jgi:hypothetical protein